MTVVEQTSELQDSRLKNFLEVFPVLKNKTIQIDLKSIKDVAERRAKNTLYPKLNWIKC